MVLNHHSPYQQKGLIMDKSGLFDKIKNKFFDTLRGQTSTQYLLPKSFRQFAKIQLITLLSGFENSLPNIGLPVKTVLARHIKRSLR